MRSVWRSSNSLDGTSDDVTGEDMSSLMLSSSSLEYEISSSLDYEILEKLPEESQGFSST